MGDGGFLQTPVSCFQRPEPNRYNPELKPQLSCSKQRAATPSNRYKNEGCILLESQSLGKEGEKSRRDAPRLRSGQAGVTIGGIPRSRGEAGSSEGDTSNLSDSRGAKVLTRAPRLLYICKVLEETGSPRAASNTTYSRGAGLVGAGFGHGFEDSSYISVQMLFPEISAEVSRLGRFVLGIARDCAAQPRQGDFE